MTIQIVCLLIGALLPYLWHGVTVGQVRRQLGSVNAEAPRQQATQLTGAGARARDAQHNAWEALIAFGAANAAALMAGVEPSGYWSLAAPLWVAARLLHGAFYVAGMAPLRVLSFTIGSAMSLWIFVLALMVD
ncbi:MAG: MAPEG family protein [Gammaproteobacteria bacterium]|nr:MAPEG family protein [Gammaproteobacteria bacterium]